MYIETTIHDYANCENTVASSFALREKPKDKKMNFHRSDGTQKICFGMREHGICKRLDAGQPCCFLHLDSSKCTECVDTEYLASSKCSVFWNCKSKHAKGRKSRAMKPSGTTGNMLRFVDVDSFQFGSPAIVGDDGEDDTDSDTLSADSDSGAIDLQPATRVFGRSGRGIRAAQYLDQTDYDDMMLADVPEHEHLAALVESVSDADICGNSGSHTGASRDSTYNGTSESNTSYDEQLVGLFDDLALSDGSGDEDPVGSTRAAVERGFPFFSQWRFQLAGLQIGREVVGAGATCTADRSANQVVRPGCLGLHSRRRDALTAAPQQDTAPLPNI